MPSPKKKKAKTTKTTPNKKVVVVAATTSITSTNHPPSSSTLDVLPSEMMLLSYPEMIERRRHVEERLRIVSIPDVVPPKKKGTTPTTLSAPAAAAAGATSGTSKRKRRPEPEVAASSIANSGLSGSISSTNYINHDVTEIPFTPKSDVHWDFVMKEMMWLGADFQGERKRQISLAKKCATSVRLFHATKESRRIKELQMAETRRKKLAAKIGRDVRGWWSKLEKVIAYKQKLHADEERKRAMNKQLVVLVQQTEKYTESLSAYAGTSTDEEDDDDDDDEENDLTSEDDSNGDGRKNRSNGERTRPRRRRNRRMTIEEALASQQSRKSKSRVVDYSRMKLETTDFYGESTASDGSGSDESYSDPSNSCDEDTDDETTLREAIEEELRSRQQQHRDHGRFEDDSDTGTKRTTPERFFPDPEELRKLHEEGRMDIDDVLKRLRDEYNEEEEQRQNNNENLRMLVDDTAPSSSPQRKWAPSRRIVKRVQFEEPDEQEGEIEKSTSSTPSTVSTPQIKSAQSLSVDAGEDADDDGDASDLEDYTTILTNQNVNDDDKGDGAVGRSGDEGSEEEFEDEDPELDDETTIAKEESLPQDMSAQEEIDLLKSEADMSIEELRQRYIDLAAANQEDDVDKENQEEGITEDDSSDGLDGHSGDEGSEEEFEDGEPELDDETTIAQEESLPQDMSAQEEIDLLKSEADMSIEELRQRYIDLAAANQQGDDNEDEQEEEVEEEEEEYQPSSIPEVDDETTIEAEEKLGRDMTYAEELDMLKNDNEMSIEELRAMYAKMDSEGVAGDEIDVDRDENGSESSDTDPMPEADDDAMDISEEQELDEKKETDAGKEMNSDSDDGAAALTALEASAERARSTLASRPFLLAGWVKLRKYQQIGLNWLVSLQTRRLNGILADEMGLGKTLQTISLLAYLASYKGIWGPHLVVVPTSVIINWETEVKRFCPGLKVLCYYGSAKRRKELRTGWTQSNWYHVVITSYQLAVQDAFAFKRKKWYYLILDEAQNIKNFQSQRWQTLIHFNTQRRLLLTGTPLQNSLMELWSLLHFLMPYIFRSRKEFSYWFSNPMNNILEGTTNRSDDVIQRLHGIIRPFVLRRLKKDVEAQMPGKFEHVVKCQLSRRQMTLYEEFLSRSSTRQALKKGGNFMGMMNVLMQLRKVCNHPDLFEPRSVITPLVLPSIPIRVPDVVCNLDGNASALNHLSDYLMQPLWCGSCGLPSLDSSLRHDQVEADELQTLCKDYKPPVLLEYDSDDDDCPVELRGLVGEIYEGRLREQSARISFQNRINRRRCGASGFPYPSQLIDAVSMDVSVVNHRRPVEVWRNEVVETPTKLLDLCMSDLRRSNAMEETIEKFVFCVPSAGARTAVLDNGLTKSSIRSGLSKEIESMLLEPLEEILKPYRKAHARLSSFFPDKKLVQFDAGKLQTLAVLLRKLKLGGHRALIFTQMSKMLDILEAFLNIHGYTYLRLDGATGVDRRQRYMDRFNNDEKIFCFILSTRSGGMGINLTGADTVIFYDSDWNPAMDAQAQDRAHRIGQTRDVHIYRLITERSIEENILFKAKQKKNLDILVMDEGNFDAAALSRTAESSSVDVESTDVFTKQGLQAILGVVDDDTDDDLTQKEKGADISKEQMEIAMASLEDEDDVKALRGAQKEAEEELKEFDENAIIQNNSDDEEEDTENPDSTKAARKQTKKSNGKDEKRENEEKAEDENVDENELEKEFAAWQSAEGFDATAIENSLSSMEKYGLRFRENIDPYYSIFAINEQRRKLEATSGLDEIDIEQVERQKAMEERQAIEDGDLLATGIRPEDLVRQRTLYRREKARLRSEKKRRKLTGENWSQRIEGLTQKPFWYNEDTGEAIWEVPHVVAELREDELARKEGWSKLPMKPLVHIMRFLVPFPDRQTCTSVCRQWRHASTDIQFVRHVYPVEMGAIARESNRRDPNHYETLSEALAVSLPGDTIELGDGHYWVTDNGLIIDKPLKLVGDENNPANVVVEMTGSVEWSGKGGWIEGITFRRPKMSSGLLPSVPMLAMRHEGKLDIVHSIFDNEGSTGPVVAVSGTGNKGRWHDVVFRNGGTNGLSLDGGVQVELTDSVIKGNMKDGISAANQARFSLTNCRVEKNQGKGIRLDKGTGAEIFDSHFLGNIEGVIQKELGCHVSSSSNTAVVHTQPARQIPGFRITLQSGNLTSEIQKQRLLPTTKTSPNPSVPFGAVTIKQ